MNPQYGETLNTEFEPPKLFDNVGHYCSLETALKILQSGEIRFSPMAEMNDPWESDVRDVYIFAPRTDEEAATLPAAMKLRDSIKRHLKLLCCCCSWRQPKHPDHEGRPWHAEGRFVHPKGCFTSNKLDPRFINQQSNLSVQHNFCWQRMRMWDQYGEKRTGACLLFDRNDLAKIIHEKFPYSTRGQVFYTTPAQRVSAAEAYVFDPDNPKKQIPMN